MRDGRLALTALLVGAAGIGFAPIFVRLSEVGPAATAFFRIAFALPALWAWDRVEGSSNEPAAPFRRGVFILAGLLFAADLACWHWSIGLTSVANATFLTNLAPFLVAVGASLFLGERLTGALVGGMSLGFIGGAMLVGSSLEFQSPHLLGDFLAVLTAFFYAGYLLTVKRLRRTTRSSAILARSGLVSAPALLAIGWVSRENFRVQTGWGWADLAGLALISHLAGQGLITYALAHLRAGFSALSLSLQPVVAAALAWMLLGEPLSALQWAGGLVILSGIGWANREHDQSPRENRTECT